MVDREAFDWTQAVIGVDCFVAYSYSSSGNGEPGCCAAESVGNVIY